MSSLKQRIELLETDLQAVPPRISVYHDLPFAILRYDPTKEWTLRREVRLLERVMHSGVQPYRTHGRMVISAYAGIQGAPLGWIPAGAGMTCNLPFHLCMHGRRAVVKMHNTL